MTSFLPRTASITLRGHALTLQRVVGVDLLGRPLWQDFPLGTAVRPGEFVRLVASNVSSLSIRFRVFYQDGMIAFERTVMRLPLDFTVHVEMSAGVREGVYVAEAAATAGIDPRVHEAGMWFRVQAGAAPPPQRPGEGSAMGLLRFALIAGLAIAGVSLIGTFRRRD